MSIISERIVQTRLLIRAFGGEVPEPSGGSNIDELRNLSLELSNLRQARPLEAYDPLDDNASACLRANRDVITGSGHDYYMRGGDNK